MKIVRKPHLNLSAGDSLFYLSLEECWPGPEFLFYPKFTFEFEQSADKSPPQIFVQSGSVKQHQNIGGGGTMVKAAPLLAEDLGPRPQNNM